MNITDRDLAAFVSARIDTLVSELDDAHRELRIARHAADHHARTTQLMMEEHDAMRLENKDLRTALRHYAGREYDSQSESDAFIQHCAEEVLKVYKKE